MKSALRIAAPLAATFIAAPVAAIAQTAILADNAALRAGPGFQFPRVAYVPENARVNVRGCVRGYDWCDVSWRGNRGWIDASNLRYSYNNRYVVIEDWGPRIGLPIVPFVIENYWASHYRDRPWWNQRYTWFERHDGWRGRDGDRWRDRDRHRSRDAWRGDRRDEWRDRQAGAGREEGLRSPQIQRDRTERLQRGETRQLRRDQADQQQRSPMGQSQMGQTQQRGQTGITQQRGQAGMTQQREDRVYRQLNRSESGQRGNAATTGRIPEQRMQRGGE